MLDPETDEVAGELRKLHEELHDLLLEWYAFVKYFRKIGNTMGQYTSTLQTSRKACNSGKRKILHNIHTDVGKPMKLVRLIKMYLHETYNTVQ